MPVSGYFILPLRILMKRIWKPNVTVAAVIGREGRFLLVEENTAEGLRLNQPAGHLEQGESLFEAVVRETLEETARPFTPGYLVGVYERQLPDDGITYLRFAFGGEAGEEAPGRALDSGIVRTVWMTADEIRASRERLRSPLVLRCIDDWLAGRRFPLDFIRSRA